MYGRNLRKLEDLMESLGLSSILITSPENIEYFLDVETIGDSTLLLHISKDGGKLYVPLLEYFRFRDRLKDVVEVVGVSRSIEVSDAVLVKKTWKEIISDIVNSESKIGVDLSYTSPLSSILSSLNSEKIIDISRNISGFRMIKDDWEIENIVEAINITGRVIHRIIDNVTNDTTETEAAGLFEYYARREGVKRYAFEPLILFKPSNSYPHNIPSNNKLGANNLILVDVGVKYNNRCSDITRMIIWGRINEEEKKVLEIVNEALDKAIEYIQPGVKASEVDNIARSVIDKYGLKEKFIHGLGHGIGVVVHEEPYIRIGSETVLEPNMVFTIEPGIYIPGVYGVRIEEDVLVTKNGVKVLSRHIPRLFMF